MAGGSWPSSARPGWSCRRSTCCGRTSARCTATSRRIWPTPRTCPAGRSRCWPRPSPPSGPSGCIPNRSWTGSSRPRTGTSSSSGWSRTPPLPSRPPEQEAGSVPQVPELNLAPILPELILAGAGMLILLVDAARPIRDQRVLAAGAMVGVLAAGVVVVRQWFVPPADELTVLGDMVAVDRYALFFRLVILASAALAISFSAHYLHRTGEGRGEYYALLLFAAIGMTLLSAAADLIVVFLALEVLSLSLYVMA